MNNIIEVNKEEKDELFEIARKGIFLGEGAEGECYLFKNNFGENETLKIIDKDVRYGINNVILDSTINLKSFAFPKKVYMNDGKVVAYTARYFTDYLKSNNNVPFIINADLFCNSISRFIDDLRILSAVGIYIYDLDYNLLFDNFNLVAIDTLNYEVRDYDTFDDNIKILKKALKETFRYKTEVILDKNVDFDQTVSDLLSIKDGSYVKKYLKTMSR